MSFLFLLALSLLIIGLGSFLLLALSWNEEKKELGLPINLFLKEYWGRSFDFTGKTRRKDFWLALFQTFFVYFFLIGVPMAIYIFYELNNGEIYYDPSLLDKFSRNISVVSWLAAIINFIPNISIQVRRLRDIGKEPAWILLAFIPFVSFILLFWYAKSSFKRESELEKGLPNYSTDSDLTNLDNAEKRLEKLKSMVDKGLISNKEYEELRKKTLGL